MGRTLGIGVLVLGGVLVLAIGAHDPIGAQFSGLGGGGFGEVQQEKVPSAPRVHVWMPHDEKVAAVQRILERPIPMRFESDTPLADVVAYIRRQSAEGDDGIEGGIPIYVDQVGLQEAEQSIQSPVSLEIEGIPLRTTLRLMLDQLDLCYEIQPEGFLVITAKDTASPKADPMLLILDELRELREEVRQLRDEARLRGGPMGM